LALVSFVVSAVLPVMASCNWVDVGVRMRFHGPGTANGRADGGWLSPAAE